MTIFLSSVGWFGAGLLVLAYYLLSRGVCHGKGPIYHTMNLVGASCVAINEGYQGTWSVVVLELVWGSVAAMTIISVLRDRQLDQV